MYQAFQAQNDLLGPIRLMAQFANGWLSQPIVSDAPGVRAVAAALELVARAGTTHSRPPFAIHKVNVEGTEVPVFEEAVLREPFCTLLHFRKEIDFDQPKVLLAAPMSGHFATLLRSTVEVLLRDHDVYVTDWHNARDVSLLHGRFDFDDYIDSIVRYLRFLGPGSHVMAVCQPSVPVLAAVALMAADNDPAQPRTMIVMGGPIDTRINETEVNRMAHSRSYDWFERNVITSVPMRYAGAFRRVYPGFIQLASFMAMNLDRHINAHVELFKKVANGDQAGANVTRDFYDEYFAVMDMPAEFYLQTIKDVFQEHRLPRGIMVSRGRPVEPRAIRRTGLMTVEGERDDICSVGQTYAAQDLCSSLSPSRRSHHLQPGAGHYGLFSGRRWENEIYPRVKEFIRLHR